MNKKILVGGLVLLIIIIIAFFLNRGQTPENVIDTEAVTLYRIAFNEEITDAGHLHIPFSADAADYAFVNVAIDLNGNGAIADYEVDGILQTEWLVRDMRANITANHANRYSIDIPDHSLANKLPVHATAVFSKEPLHDNEDGAFFVPEKHVIVETFTISAIEIDNLGAKFSSDETGLNETGPGSGIFSIPVVHAQKAGDPGYGSEYGTFPDPNTVPDGFIAEAKGMPDLDQAYNECAPTAIANSFRWLAKTNGFENRIPESDQALIDEIKGYTEWTQTGVKPGNALVGKQAFIEARGLPLEAHIIADQQNPQYMFYKIYQEMAKGQAVELSIQFWDENDRPDGAHLVTVQEVFRAKSGKQWITINDPGTDARNDKKSGDVYRFDNNGNEITGYLSKGRATVRYAIAQSPIKSVTDGTWVDQWSDSNVLIGTDVNLRAGSEVSLGISKWRFFNVTVDDPGDHMVGDTFPVTARVVKRDGDATVNVGTSTFKFTAENPWNLQGIFKSSKNLSVTPQANKPPRTSTSNRQFTVTTEFTCTEPGIAHVVYVADLGWVQSGGQIPERISKYYSKELLPGDTVEVQSPPFRCIGIQTEEQQKESRTAILTTCGIVQDPNGVEIETLVIDQKCFPKSQFRSAEPDRCDSKHWHGGKVYSLDGTEKTDPEGDGCGFGKVKDVEVRKIKIDQPTAAQFLGSIFEDLPIPEDPPTNYEYDLNGLDSKYLDYLAPGAQFDYTIKSE